MVCILARIDQFCFQCGLLNYGFKQNEKSLVAHTRSSVAHQWAAAQRLRTTALECRKTRVAASYKFY